MPTFSRKSLRQALGQNYIRDTIVGNTTSSWGALGSLSMMDSVVLANLDFSGQGLYAGGFLRVASGDYRVGSANVASGALVSAQAMRAAIASGADYEFASLLSAAEKDQAINDAIKRLRINQEVGVNTVDGALHYTIDGAASPHYIEDVLDVYYFSDPAGSLNRGETRLAWFDVKPTPTGTELRIAPALGASQQIILDALLALTLGAGDAATINIPDERLVLWGAEAQCWDRLSKRTPGTATQQYQQFRDNAARQYSQLAAKFKPQVARRIQFDEPVTRGSWSW